MLKKILRILAKTVVGVCLFYLLLGFVIIPLVMVWAIPSQGTKFLKTPVKVKSAFLNPVLGQLRINGLGIFDQQKQLLVGFDKLFVDVSFTNLFKKIYRVEAFRLDGLKINVVLLPDGKINLLALVPPAPAAKPGAPAQATPSPSAAKPTPAPTEKAAAVKTVEMPLVIVDEIALKDGAIRFEDQSITPHFSTLLNALDLLITGVTTKPDAQVKVAFKAKLDEKGAISVDVLANPLKQPFAGETSVSLNGYAMQILTPYVGKYTGRTLDDGRMDVKMDYRIGDNKITASHKLLIQNFEFGQKVDSKDALNLPFGLAVALLEDPQGKINIALPVNGDMSKPDFEYWPLVGQVARNFFIKLVTKPFAALGPMISGGESGTDELGYVKFSPGKADLSDAEKQKLTTLAKGLNERPKLRLEVDGSYDPAVDWKAIQTEVFTKDYEKLKGDSSGDESKIYQMLYQRRFGLRALWALAKKYKAGVGKYDEVKFNDEIKRQLIENAPPDTIALTALAKSRAQIVHDFLLKAGFSAGRLTMGQVKTTQSSMGYVPLEFTLTFFEEQK